MVGTKRGRIRVGCVGTCCPKELVEKRKGKIINRELKTNEHIEKKGGLGVKKKAVLSPEKGKSFYCKHKKGMNFKCQAKPSEKA